MQLLGVQCKEQKCATRTPLPKSHPAAVDEADLERFRERPDDTMAELQKRRETVEQRINGEYPNCQLTANGKFVVCT
jgi:hypothetical protein